MKLLTVKKLKDIIAHCKQDDEYLVSEDDLKGLLEFFGDEYHMSVNNHWKMELSKKNDKSYESWYFHTDR